MVLFIHQNKVLIFFFSLIPNWLKPDALGLVGRGVQQKPQGVIF